LTQITGATRILLQRKIIFDMETPVICAVMEKDLNTTQKQALPITSSSMLVNDKNERRVNRVFYQEKMDYN
jgi:hypothetical protein